MLKSNCWIKFPPPSGLPGCIWSSAPSELCFPFGQTDSLQSLSLLLTECYIQSRQFRMIFDETFIKHMSAMLFFFFSFQRLYAATLLTGSFKFSCLSKLIADDEHFTLAAGLRIKTQWQKLHRNVQKKSDVNSLAESEVWRHFFKYF